MIVLYVVYTNQYTAYDRNSSPLPTLERSRSNPCCPGAGADGVDAATDAAADVASLPHPSLVARSGIAIRKHLRVRRPQTPPPPPRQQQRQHQL